LAEVFGELALGESRGGRDFDLRVAFLFGGVALSGEFSACILVRFLEWSLSPSSVDAESVSGLLLSAGLTVATSLLLRVASIGLCWVSGPDVFPEFPVGVDAFCPVEDLCWSAGDLAVFDDVLGRLPSLFLPSAPEPAFFAEFRRDELRTLSIDRRALGSRVAALPCPSLPSL